LKKPIKFGKYVLLERINVGGMAEVFKAKSFGVEGFQKMLAIKRILPNIAEDEEFITMFIDEAKIAVQLSHANIAQIYDLGKIDDSYFIALEFIHGKDLRTIWDRHKKRGLLLPIPMSVYIMSRTCEGLDYAHRKKDASGRGLNIVHRDISPQNILISYEGEIKIIDFGIAKAANKASKTQAGILKGKFGYMSPEQVRGLPLDRRSDVFSAGIVLYELLTGERLFVAESDFSTLEKVRNVEILPPSTYNRKIPDALEKIVLKALSKDPDDRFQNAYEMQEDLQRFLILNKTNFARKDLANYMKRAFKADIERSIKRHAEYQKITPEDLEEEDTLSGQTAPAHKPAGQPRSATTLPNRRAPVGMPPPTVAPTTDIGPATEQVFLGDDDEDDDIETVVFDPREAQIDTSRPATSPPELVPPPLATKKTTPSKPSSPINDLAFLDEDNPDEEAITMPGGISAPEIKDEILSGYDMQDPFENAPPQKTSRLNLVIIILAVLATMVLGLAVLKLLQQKGIIGAGSEIVVEVKPPDAQVFIDDKLVGDFSPNKIHDLEPGHHVLLVKRNNYQDYKQELNLSAGEPKKISVEMKYIPAMLELSVEPPQADVTMDGKYLLTKKGKLYKDDILPGEDHVFVFKSSGYKTKTLKWKFEPKQTRKEKVVLKKAPFVLSVNSDPSGCSIYLDDKKIGVTPKKIKGLDSTKTYKLLLRHPSYNEWSSTIRYDEDQPVQKVFKRMDQKGAGQIELKHKAFHNKHFGMLSINAKPWGNVLIDGRYIGRQTPVLKYKLPIGKHKVTIRFSSGGQKSAVVNIREGKTTKKLFSK